MSTTRILRTVLALSLGLGLLLSPGAAAAGSGSTVVWRVLVMVFDQTHARCNGELLQGTLDQAAAQRMLDDFAARVAAWSDGVARLELTVRHDTYLVALSGDGSGGCWPAPGDIYDNEEEPYPGTGYDSVVVLWDADGSLEQHASASFGLSYTDLRPGGATYATAIVPDGAQAWWLDSATPGLVLVHEWGNGALAWYRQFSRRVPSWYDHAAYGYASGSLAWYEDVLGGDVLVNAKRKGEVDRYGLTPKRWRAGTPTG